MVKYLVIVASLFCGHPEDGAVKTKLIETQSRSQRFLGLIDPHVLQI